MIGPRFITKVYLAFNYGAWGLGFEKIFELPCAPFYDMILFEDENENENSIRFSNDDCGHSAEIYFNVKEDNFFVDVREHWKYPVRDDVVDDMLEKFTSSGWKRTDTTDVNQLKELMNRDYNRNKS